MAGQSVGMVTEEEPVTQIVATLMRESEEALSRR
jgi:enoyl-[acyl-carrier protein] reductase II